MYLTTSDPVAPIDLAALALKNVTDGTALPRASRGEWENRRMPEHHVSSRGSGSKHSALDTDAVPLGERAQRSILDHVIAVGDQAETTYLEVRAPST